MYSLEELLALMSFAVRAWVAGAGVVCFRSSLNRCFESLMLLVLYLVQLGIIFIFQIEVGVVPLDVVALHIISDFNLLLYSSEQRNILGEMCCLESTENVDIPILEHASCGMVPSFPELRLELKPSVSIDVVPLHRPLAEFELLKLHEVLVSSATNGVDEAVVALSICKVRPTCVHEFSLFQHVLFQDVFIILAGIGTTHHVGSKSCMRDYRLVAFGLHRWRNLDLVLCPRTFGIWLVQPYIAI